MEAPGDQDFAVVPDNGAQPGQSNTASFPPLTAQGLPAGQGAHDSSAIYNHISPKMFTYDGQAAQQYLAGLGTNGVPTSVVPVMNQPPQQQQLQQRQQPGSVPQQQQQQQQQQNAQRLSASQQSELEMARRRAEKAAEGKRANATAARRAKRRASRNEPPEREGTESSEELPMHSGNSKDDIEARLATVEDEKEAKRLKRLLRNRVSAQQARERKKSYVSTLESKSAGQDDKIAQLGQRVKTLERENVMLRQIIKNMQQGSALEPELGT